MSINIGFSPNVTEIARGNNSDAEIANAALWLNTIGVGTKFDYFLLCGEVFLLVIPYVTNRNLTETGTIAISGYLIAAIHCLFGALKIVAAVSPNSFVFAKGSPIDVCSFALTNVSGSSVFNPLPGNLSFMGQNYLQVSFAIMLFTVLEYERGLKFFRKFHHKLVKTMSRAFPLIATLFVFTWPGVHCYYANDTNVVAEILCLLFASCFFFNGVGYVARLNSVLTFLIVGLGALWVGVTLSLMVKENVLAMPSGLFAWILPIFTLLMAIYDAISQVISPKVEGSPPSKIKIFMTNKMYEKAPKLMANKLMQKLIPRLSTKNLDDVENPAQPVQPSPVFPNNLQQNLPQPPLLPVGWSTQWDSQHQRYFFIEQATGRTQWELP
ncbi:hypothetical protein HK100_007488 [Physocladia obscura]|uniref:WW domain-containing protein n=1 Tax=Physocladia obscura TaxID=109957 RepID=A0AAD5SQJ7_9FUNG|nr:hypothetical protein HK100_007488 [Physocladia obscura]